MPSSPRVYVGTLYSGEVEIEACRASVQAQHFDNLVQEVIEFLPNREAHDTLYRRFMSLRKDYDYLIKLDADMEFVDDRAVAKLVAFFQDNTGLDHLQLTVHDFYTDTSVFGVHCYSNRCRWEASAEDVLFVDPFPAIAGERLALYARNAGDNLVRHAFGQRRSDAYAFGYHKAMKLTQPGRVRRDSSQVFNHWNNIRGLVAACRSQPEILRKHALCGAHDCLAAGIEGQALVDHDRYKAELATPAECSDSARRFAASSLFRYAMLCRALGAGDAARLVAQMSRGWLRRVVGRPAVVGACAMPTALRRGAREAATTN